MKNLKNIVYTAVFAALICVAIMFLRIPVNFGMPGYYHVGDSIIFFAAVCLAFPYAPIAGALGGALANLFLGIPIYLPWTFVIKFLIAISFTNNSNKVLCQRNIAALLVAGVVTVLGYFVAELVITQTFATAVATIYGNIAQFIVSAAIFLALSPAIPRIKSAIFKDI